jgi:hypothetical protein
MLIVMIIVATRKCLIAKGILNKRSYGLMDIASAYKKHDV